MDIRSAQFRLGVAQDGVLGPKSWAALFAYAGARSSDAITFGHAMAEHGQDVNTPLEVCHFLAQAAHETMGFRYLCELGGPNYCARYDGRHDLGNCLAGDGYRFRGRGIFQITGRANYTTIGPKLGLDLAGNPDLAAEPYTAVLTALLYWRSHGLAALAAADNLTEITHRINGGQNGADDRATRLTHLKALFA